MSTRVSFVAALQAPRPLLRLALLHELFPLHRGCVPAVQRVVDAMSHAWMLDKRVRGYASQGLGHVLLGIGIVSILAWVVLFVRHVAAVDSKLLTR